MTAKDIKSNRSYIVSLKDCDTPTYFIVNFGKVTDNCAIDEGYVHVLSTSLENSPISLGWRKFEELDKELDILNEWPPHGWLVKTFTDICSWPSFKKHLGLDWKKEQVLLDSDGTGTTLNMTILLRKAKPNEDYCKRIHDILCAMVNYEYFEITDIHFKTPIDIENCSQITIYKYDPVVRMISETVSIKLTFGTI